MTCHAGSCLFSYFSTEVTGFIINDIMILLYITENK